MTDKLYEQLGSILDGTRRYKLLDPRRKAVLALPANAFKLWMAYWMFESDDREAYPKRETLEKATGMSKPTLLTARQYLIETGWLVKVDGSAGSRYTKPSTGSWNIGIYRVDDPSGKESLPLEPDAVKKFDHDAVKNSYRSKNFTGKESYPNVASAFAVASTGTTTVTSPATDTLATQHTPCMRESLAPPKNSLREEKPEQPPTGTKPEEPRRSRMEQLKARSAFWLKQYTEPPSVAFFTFNENLQAYWITGHTRHKDDPLAPSMGRYRCPACEFTTNNSTALVRHLPAEHEETLRRLHG